MVSNGPISDYLEGLPGIRAIGFSLREVSTSRFSGSPSRSLTFNALDIFQTFSDVAHLV
jgi:hypothetical protein